MNARPDSAEPRDWLEYASADLRVAEHTLRTMQPCPNWIVTYHAQQCVEKAIKGYLISRGKKPPYTHDLRLLLDLCQDEGANWVGRARPAEKIMSFSIVERYPSRIRVVTQEHAESAVEIAGFVFQLISETLTHD